MKAVSKNFLTSVCMYYVGGARVLPFINSSDKGDKGSAPDKF